MGYMLKDQGGDFEPLEEGTHIARCVTVVDIGIQESKFGNKEKIYLGFEVPGQRVLKKNDDGKEEDIGPALIGSTYTASISPKSILGQHLISWRGRAFTEEEKAGFNIFNVLGVPCMISVTHRSYEGKTYANITGIMKLPKEMAASVPEAETPLVAYTPQSNEYSGNFDKLPEWLQKKVTEGHRMEAPGSMTPAIPAGGADVNRTTDQDRAAAQEYADEFNDDIPF
jgi:hypothetical protein